MRTLMAKGSKCSKGWTVASAIAIGLGAAAPAIAELRMAKLSQSDGCAKQADSRVSQDAFGKVKATLADVAVALGLKERKQQSKLRAPAAIRQMGVLPNIPKLLDEIADARKAAKASEVAEAERAAASASRQVAVHQSGSASVVEQGAAATHAHNTAEQIEAAGRRLDELIEKRGAQRAAAARAPSSRIELTKAERLELHQDLVQRSQKYSAHSLEKLLSDLGNRLAPESSAQLRKMMSEFAGKDLVTQSDLAKLQGYMDFLESRGISAKSFPLEIRVEGKPGSQKAYILTDVDKSLIRDAKGETLAWTHDEAWAKERFYDNTSGNYLLGQWPGTSKFVALGKFPANPTKSQMLERLGLKGYPAFDKPGPFYVVSADLSPLRYDQLKPKVPFMYKWTDDNGKFVVANNFGDQTIPGFTSGGSAEVIIPTFQEKAGNLAELEQKGVRISAYND